MEMPLITDGALPLLVKAMLAQSRTGPLSLSLSFLSVLSFSNVHVLVSELETGSHSANEKAFSEGRVGNKREVYLRETDEEGEAL